MGTRLRFTKEQDQKLIEAVERFGRQNWTNVARHVGTTSRRCRERYIILQNPDNTWSPTDDDEVLKLNDQHPRKWRVIANIMGRERNAVRNRICRLQRQMVATQTMQRHQTESPSVESNAESQTPLPEQESAGFTLYQSPSDSQTHEYDSCGWVEWSCASD